MSASKAVWSPAGAMRHVEDVGGAQVQGANASALARLWQRLLASPYLLLVGTMMVWGGNGTAARLATNSISPMLLVLLRWAVVCAILLPPLGRQVMLHLPTLRANWLRLFGLAFTGMSGFNTIYYLAAFRTSALNVTLLQSMTQVFVLLAVALTMRVRITALQSLGVAISFVAIALIASQGDLHRLSHLSFGRGDLLGLGAAALNAIFTLGLRHRPPMPALVFFAGMAFAALIEALPLAIAEWATGLTVAPTPLGWGVVAYSALGSSFVAQLAYMRSVALIGPSRVALFNNLTPIFGAVFAVCLLGETFTPYYGLALVLTIGGIYLAERAGTKVGPVAPPPSTG